MVMTEQKVSRAAALLKSRERTPSPSGRAVVTNRFQCTSRTCVHTAPRHCKRRDKEDEERWEKEEREEGEGACESESERVREQVREREREREREM
jgi:hypothetical protein